MKPERRKLVAVMALVVGTLLWMNLGLAAVYEAYVGKSGMPDFERGTA